MSAETHERTNAETRKSWWPGWIWAVPIAAVGVALWLGLRALAQGGESVTVTFNSAYGMKPGDTKVMLKGLQVGKVDHIALIDQASAVSVKLKLDGDVGPYLRTGTRFWLQGAQVSLTDPASLKAILAGPTIEMDPGPGAKTKTFKGLSQSPAESPEGPQTPYLVRFQGAVGGLKPGAPVDLRGFRVGHVIGVSLAYDAGTGQLETPVTIALEPDRLHIHGVAPPVNGNWRPIVDDMLRTLIGRGLRAGLSQSPPLVGARQVDLEFVPGAKAQGLPPAGDIEEIPTAPGSNLQSLTAKANQVMSRADDAMAHADEVLAKADEIPLADIGQNVRAITTRIRGLVSSPKISDAIAHVDATTAQLDQTVHQVSPNVEATVAKLRQTADQADATVAAAKRVVGGDALSQDGDVPSALRELTDAARAIRALANELQRHPELIIKGKSDGHAR